MADTSLTYREKFLRNQLQFKNRYKKLFDKVAEDISFLANDPNIKFTKAFKFNRPIGKKITAIIAEFHDNMLSLTKDEITYSWNLSNSKNDKIVGDYIKTITAVKTAQKAAYLLPNIPALKAFIAREKNAETLSDAVWKVSKQLRAEMEVHLGLGIMNGDSANVISQRIRQYLQNPEALFRRVRDAEGKLVASEAMIANAPGQGVYNSAYKNAVRLARTETNQAYLLADHIRWQQIDMVIGVRIELSDQHPDYNFPEICEELEGDYPKDFIFVGFHPNCLCHATPIMSESKNFMDYLKGKTDLETTQITEYPKNFVDFWEKNYEKYSNYKSVPYVLQDNKKIIESLIKK